MFFVCKLIFFIHNRRKKMYIFLLRGGGGGGGPDFLCQENTHDFPNNGMKRVASQNSSYRSTLSLPGNCLKIINWEKKGFYFYVMFVKIKNCYFKGRIWELYLGVCVAIILHLVSLIPNSAIAKTILITRVENQPLKQR